MTSILLPIFNEKEANEFYIDIMNFREMNNILFLPNDNHIEILYQNIRDEQFNQHPIFLKKKERFPLFRYEIESEFLFFIKNLVKNGVVILKMFQHPGGYFAKIQDPFFNTFEVICNELENEAFIDPNEWEFYKRL